MLAEDTVPYALGTRPRYVLDGIERGGTRELSYPLRSDLRGKFTIGPLEVRIADAFGQAATHAPQPIHAAASIARSA